MPINTITSWEFNNASFPSSNTQIYQVVDMSPPNTFTYQGGWIAASGTRLADAPASPAAAPVSIDLVSKVLSGSSAANLCAAVRAALGITDASIISPKYLFALRAAQSGFGAVIDQSPNGAATYINPYLWPAGWAASTTYTAAQLRMPTIMNGLLYKCTTGGVSAATEPTWPTTIGTTVTDGSVVWTCAKGPWFVNNSLKTFRTVATSDLGGSAVGFDMIPGLGTAWDMANGDSFIFHAKMNGLAYAGAGFKTCAAVAQDATTPGLAGWSIMASPTPFFDLRLQITDAAGNTFLSGNLSQYDATLSPLGIKRPLDGGTRSVMVAVDGKLKRSYFYIDGVPVPQAAMNSGSDLTPHDASLLAVTGSTATAAGALMLGCRAPVSTTTYEFGFTAVDYLVLENQSLPGNLATIAAWLRDRSSLIPASQVV